MFVALSPIVSAQDHKDQKDLVPKYEIVSNMSRQDDLANHRTIYVLLDSDTFELDQVSWVIRSLESKYCSPFSLRMVIFSDREMLESQRRGTASDIVTFDRSPAGRKALIDHLRKIYPPPTGYMRAFYYRNKHHEYFEYSPKSDSIEIERYILRDPSARLGDTTRHSFEATKCESGVD